MGPLEVAAEDRGFISLVVGGIVLAHREPVYEGLRAHPRVVRVARANEASGLMWEAPDPRPGFVVFGL